MENKAAVSITLFTAEQTRSDKHPRRVGNQAEDPMILFAVKRAVTVLYYTMLFYNILLFEIN